MGLFKKLLPGVKTINDKTELSRDMVAEKLGPKWVEVREKHKKKLEEKRNK